MEPGGEFLVCLARACEAMPVQSPRALGDLEHWTQELPRIDFRTIRIQVFRQKLAVEQVEGLRNVGIFLAFCTAHFLCAVRSFARQLQVTVFQVAAGKQWQTACNQHAKIAMSQSQDQPSFA